ncbi:hypothetical protein XENTR_v10010356 [Xenopus tropicalis]|uniref:Uncharacterized protein LOC116409846 n=1 Tax=Xenopus tropicalis TaxID=8364 RepID=A0A8J1JEI5_XENTR|nr:uncharacterized protein LOC116409846 [Xenopus tropicalis]KAE8620597.1 hypothetical protein XENTR_v10010356 [Xenopus tropicalis]
MSLASTFKALADYNSHFVKTFLLTLLLLGLERFLETEFECPEGYPVFRVLYSLTFFVLPAAILVFVRWKFTPVTLCQGNHGCCAKMCYGLISLFTFPVIWVLILIVDGRYLYCILPHGEGDIKRQIIQMAGVCTFALLIIAYCITWPACGCTKNCAKHYDEMEAEILLQNTIVKLKEDEKKIAREQEARETMKNTNARANHSASGDNDQNPEEVPLQTLE